MAQSVYGSVNPMDLQPGEHLVDGLTIQAALQPQAARSGLTALAGGGASGATGLLPGLNEVDTVVTAADSCLLPLALAGTSVEVYNATAATSLTVWPQQSNPNNSGGAADAITNLAGNAVLSLACAAATVQIFRCFKAGTWKATV
jgi:hypothetical protein